MSVRASDFGVKELCKDSVSRLPTRSVQLQVVAMTDDDRADAMRRRARELRDRSVALTIQALQLRERATSASGLSAALIASLRDNRAQNERLLRSSVELRRTITEYVTALHHLGEPPERAVEDVRLIADDAGYATHVGRADREALVNQMVLWAIDALAA